MDKVQHFEIPADDMTRAKKFYSEVFSWKLMDAPMPGMEYVMASTTEVDEKSRMPKEVGAINGGLFKRNPVAQHPTLAITVADITAALEKVKASGGIVLGEPQKVGDMGLYVYVKDTEGNVIGVWQELKRAS